MMSTIFKKRNMQKITVLVSLTMITIFLGHGCSDMVANQTPGASTSSISGTLGGTTGGSDGAGGGFSPIAGASTVSLVYNKQVVDNMVLCSGIGTASAKSMDEWKKRQSSFSEYGYATDVTAPMLMALAAVSGEVCNDLLKLETALPATSRRIFNSFDFNSGVSALTSSQVADATRRLARSCWARNEDADELAIINEEVTAAKVGVSGSEAKQTRNVALMLCTSMMASLSGISL